MEQGFIHPQFLVETEWLAAHLNDPAVRLLDCTTHLLPPTHGGPYDVLAGRADYEKGHIPGAGFVDLDHEVSDRDHRLHFMLPKPEQFAAAMSALGVGDDTRVVTYSTANHWWATRLWWMLRVFGHDNAAVLNGGFQKWVREGRPVESGPAKTAAAARFTSRYRAGHVVGKQDVRAAIGDEKVCTVNALRPEQHAGSGGTNYGRPGHISGSINIAAVNAVDADNMFKSAPALRTMFAPALAAPRVIAYCGGGIAATSAALVLTMLGHDNVQVYDASLSEWAEDASLPMEVG